jgi:hypothetical protein
MKVLDEMRSIRCIGHTGKAKKIIPFIGKRLTVCDACGYDVPNGCEPPSGRPLAKAKKAAKRLGKVAAVCRSRNLCRKQRKIHMYLE